MEETSKAKEIYARFGVQLRNHRAAFKAEKLAPGAMSLYLFCTLDARGELPPLDGFIPEEVAHTAWGRPEKERRAHAQALVDVGLLRPVDGGYVVEKYLEHNDGRADVERAKAREREKKRDQRGRPRESPTMSPSCPQGTPEGHEGGVLNSISPSFSPEAFAEDEDVGEPPRGGAGEGVVQRDTTPGNMFAIGPEGTPLAGMLIPMKPPEWFSDVVDTVRANTGEAVDARLAWSRYSAHRAKSGKPMSPMDAQYFVTTVDVVEAKRERQLARERIERRDEDEHRQAARARRGMSPAAPVAKPKRPAFVDDDAHVHEHTVYMRRLDVERVLGTGS